MGKPAAKQGDDVVGIDTHIVLVSSPSGPVPTPLPSPFRGPLSAALSATVRIDEVPAAIDGSEAMNSSPHVPAGGPFQNPPANKGTAQASSSTVFMDDKPCVRNGDQVMTCNDPADAPKGRVIAASTVIAG